MTVAVGFRCTDGVILATDKEESIGPDAKIRVEKIHAQYITAGGSCAIAGAGRSSLIHVLIQSILSDLEDLNIDLASVEWKAIEAVIKNCTNEMFNENIAPYLPLGEEHLPQAHALVSVHTKRGIRLYVASPPKILINITASPLLHVAIGNGYSVATPLMDSIHTVRMTMEETADLALYIVKRTKLLTQGVGLESDVLYHGMDQQFRDKTKTHLNSLDMWSDAVDALTGDMWLHALRGNQQKLKKTLREIASIAPKKPSEKPRNVWRDRE